MTRFDQFVEHLKNASPLRRRLVIRRMELKKNYGQTSISESCKTITVVLDSRLTFTEAVDTLIHEWGHVLDYDHWDDHGRLWGKYQAEAYRAWETFLEEGN